MFLYGSTRENLDGGIHKAGDIHSCSFFSTDTKINSAFSVSRFESGDVRRTYFKCRLVDIIIEERSNFVGCMVIPCKVTSDKITKNQHTFNIVVSANNVNGLKSL